VINTTRSRGDSQSRALSEAAVAELNRRLAGGRGWVVATPDTARFTTMRGAPGSRGASTVFNGPAGGIDSTDMLVLVSVQKDLNDSSWLSVTIRNAKPGSSYGNQIITSDRVNAPTSIDPFRGTVRDVSRTLEWLRNLPPGTAWPSTVPRNAGGRGGPSDYMGPEFQRQMEEFRRLDSMKIPRPKIPPATGGN
jgi:hypothetical protein